MHWEPGLTPGRILALPSTPSAATAPGWRGPGPRIAKAPGHSRWTTPAHPHQWAARGASRYLERGERVMPRLHPCPFRSNQVPRVCSCRNRMLPGSALTLGAGWGRGSCGSPASLPFLPPPSPGVSPGQSLCAPSEVREQKRHQDSEDCNVSHDHWPHPPHLGWAVPG